MHLLLFRQRQGFPLAVAGSNMVPRGLEPRTLRLLAVRSNQLSYETLGKYIQDKDTEIDISQAKLLYTVPVEIQQYLKILKLCSRPLF